MQCTEMSLVEFWVVANRDHVSSQVFDSESAARRHCGPDERPVRLTMPIELIGFGSHYQSGLTTFVDSFIDGPPTAPEVSRPTDNSPISNWMSSDTRNTDSMDRTPGVMLHNSYCRYCSERGLETVSLTGFYRKLRQLGIPESLDANRICFHGIQVKSPSRVTVFVRSA